MALAVTVSIFVSLLVAVYSSDVSNTKEGIKERIDFRDVTGVEFSLQNFAETNSGTWVVAFSPAESQAAKRLVGYSNILRRFQVNTGKVNTDSIDGKALAEKLGLTAPAIVLFLEGKDPIVSTDSNENNLSIGSVMRFLTQNGVDVKKFHRVDLAKMRSGKMMTDKQSTFDERSRLSEEHRQRIEEIIARNQADGGIKMHGREDHREFFERKRERKGIEHNKSKIREIEEKKKIFEQQKNDEQNQ